MNKDFEAILKSVLKDDEILIFKEKLKEKSSTSLYINSLKNDKEAILNKIDFVLKKVDQHPDMYFYEKENIGKTWQYQCGLFYPQEISAGIAPLILNPLENKVILDMCSAPGGKAIQLANLCKDNATLILNEYDFKRSLIELSNIEKTGFSNYILFNKNPKQIAEEFKESVDYCLIDAPCSGEGMIRKKPDILKTYNKNLIKSCVLKQRNILDSAYEVLKKDAYLVYSTCTYNLEENEKNVAYFLKKYPDMQLLEIRHKHKRKGIVQDGINEKYLLRFNIIDGSEGQFIALFKKTSGKDRSLNYLVSDKHKIVDKFIKDNLKLDNYYVYIKNNEVYIKFNKFIATKIDFIRQGIFLGIIKNNTLIPQHHFYRCNYLKDKFKYKYNLNDEQYLKYIKGLELELKLDNNYYAITYKDELLGYGKVVNGVLKNKYPKGLRI